MAGKPGVDRGTREKLYTCGPFPSTLAPDRMKAQQERGRSRYGRQANAISLSDSLLPQSNQNAFKIAEAVVRHDAWTFAYIRG
jgi:hypothetical protein